MVFYRKYRPQLISELDLDAVRQRLESILKAKELPHAFLFTGPKGLGKTSAARILAKSISCPNRKGIEPCNKCDVCLSITNGSNIDVLEIDAASNRGIDEIRDLRDKIKFLPASLPHKVYIIDEVHMLTTDAFNALLKTLEEPPTHAIFILCTTEVEKVPPTIASRTFHVQFNKPTKEEIVRSLARIIEGEKLDIEKEVLDEIFKLSENSFRDAAKILEELAIGSPDKKITNETLASIYKTAGLESQVNDLLTTLSKKDLQNSMKIVENLAQRGADFKFVTEKMAELIHGMLMTRAGIGSIEFDVKEMETSELKLLLERINESYRDIKFSVLPQIPLELVVVGYCLESRIMNPFGESQGKQESREEQVAHSKISGQAVRSSEVEEKTVSSENPQKAEPVRPFDRTQDKQVQDKPPERPQKTHDDTHGALFNANSKPDSFMAAFLVKLKEDNHSIAGILRGCRLVEITPDQVLFETKYKFHKDKLNEAAANEVLDKRASEILRENVHVVVNLVA